MKEHDILQKIEKIVQDEKLDASLFAPSEKIPYDNLIVFIGADSLSRPYVLNITAQSQILDPKKDSGIFRVSFQLKLPFKIAEFSFSQTSNLIALLNRFLELPGLEINEVTQEIFYRYVLLVDEKGLNKEIILGIIGMIRLILDIHLKSIESVASGSMTYDQLLSQALDASF